MDATADTRELIIRFVISGTNFIKRLGFIEEFFAPFYFCEGYRTQSPAVTAAGTVRVKFFYPDINGCSGLEDGR